MAEDDKQRLNVLLGAARDLLDGALTDPEQCVLAEVTVEHIAWLESRIDPVRH